MPKRGEHVTETPNSTANPLLQNIFGVSADFLGQLRTWFEQNPPAIPVSQIVGFSQFAAQVATVATLESTTSTTYTNLTTTGPTLTGLPDGKYIVVVSAAASGSSAGIDAWMSYAINSGAASDSTGSRSSTANIAGLVMFSLASLAGGGNNTITAKYRTSSSTSSFSNRCLFALRYANL